MSSDKEKLIAELVNKGLDGDMDAVNACDDKIIRAKVKAMIMKVKKGTVNRPPLPQASLPDKKINEKSLSKEDLIALLVNKGLDGDMDAVNACDDKMIRAKVKAMIMKVNKGAIERPKNPDIINSDLNESEQDTIEHTDDKVENNFQVIKNNISDKYSDEITDESLDNVICLKPAKWFEIAQWLKSDPALLFDSLQCQMGIDIGDGMLESRYNLHSMQHDHYLEIRIKVNREDAKIPSVEKVWRIADWFERETYDMLGIEYIGHRDLRRILLPDDWEGWPLRKDYQEQETYHGIVVPKIKEGWD